MGAWIGSSAVRDSYHSPDFSWHICDAMNQMLLVGRGQGCEAGGGQWLMQRGEGDESRFCFLCPSGLGLPLCPSGRGCITGNRETRERLLDPRQAAALSLLKIVKQSTKLRLQCGGRCNLLIVRRKKYLFVSRLLTITNSRCGTKSQSGIWCAGMRNALLTWHCIFEWCTTSREWQLSLTDFAIWYGLLELKYISKKHHQH